MSEDYFAAEQPIVDLLMTAIPEVHNRVFTVNDLDKVTNESQTTPALHVLYGGDILGRCGSNGQAQQFDQIWIVVLVVDNAAAQRSGAKIRVVAGPIIFKLLRVLEGFVPLEGHCEALHRIEAAEAIYKSGLVAFPFAFTTKLTI